MSETNAATGKFTTLTPELLKGSMARVEGVATVATVNEDNTPNAGIFVTMMPDEDHVSMVLAPNRTRSNIERTKTCVVTYTVMDASASQKADRYKGARLKLELVTPQDEGYQELCNRTPRFNPYTLLFRIVDYMQIG